MDVVYVADNAFQLASQIFCASDRGVEEDGGVAVRFGGAVEVFVGGEGLLKETVEGFGEFVYGCELHYELLDTMS